MLSVVSAIFRLGVQNVWRVAVYRVLLKVRLHKVIFLRISKVDAEGAWFQNVDPWSGPAVSDNLERGGPAVKYFGWVGYGFSGPPFWHRSLLNPEIELRSDLPWWKITAPRVTGFDIKGVWEASRFGWVVRFAQQARSGDEEALRSLNSWLTDWNQHNQPFYGANWQCAQECSIRVIHLAAGSAILSSQREMSPAISNFVHNHLKRISKTLQYAIGQQNNHLVSEGVALFVGGSWLAENGFHEGRRFEKIGRRILERHFPPLVYEDGEFAQHSSNYQRLTNDLLCFLEIWRLMVDRKPFSSRLYSKARDVNRFLGFLTSNELGECPNMGGNDGALLIPLISESFSDYRESVKVGQTIFSGRCDDVAGQDSEYLRWFGMKPDALESKHRAPDDLREARREVGGLEKIRLGTTRLFFRRPGYRFRPPNCDALHVDLWVDGTNVFRDAGSFSYGATEDLLLAFHGSRGHNVVIFDGHDQMPLLSRFLFGRWPKSAPHPWSGISDEVFLADAYRDYRGNYHARKVELGFGFLRITDQFSGNFTRAVLRWRLAPYPWTLAEGVVVSELGKISVSSSHKVTAQFLGQTEESRYYGLRERIPVFETWVEGEGELVTTFSFSL